MLVGARLFCEMLRRMPDGVVTVEAENGTVTVKCGRSSFNLVGMSAEDYPDLPSVEAENGVSLPQDLLKKMINECSFAVSTNESRPVYMGTLFEIAHNELTMVSVDGYRLALRREPVEGYGDDCSFIVPGTALSDLERLCGDSDERVKMSVGSKHISFTVGSTVILSRRLEGDFLNYKKAIPESFRITVKTARTDLLDVVERVSLIVDSKNNAPLRLTFRKDAIDFVCTTPLGKAADSCPCEGDGGDLEIGFNDHYLSDALKGGAGGRAQRLPQHRLEPVHLRAGGRQRQLCVYGAAGASARRTVTGVRTMETITIETEFIKLDALLKFAALTGTGGEAKQVITDGMVAVNGETCTMRGKKIRPGDTVTFAGHTLQVQSAQ